MRHNAQRRLVLVTGVLFGLSLLFPLVASILLTSAASRWLGLLDVSVALVLMAMVTMIDRRAQGHRHAKLGWL